jgi:hypothetical protein
MDGMDFTDPTDFTSTTSSVPSPVPSTPQTDPMDAGNIDQTAEMRRVVVLLTVASILVAMLVFGGAATAQSAVPTDLRAFMTGQQVAIPCFFPPCGDPNGSGLAVVRAHKVKVCYTLDVRRIKPATAASIHRGVRGENGPVIVPFLNAPTDGSSSGCVAISKALSRQLREHPGRYYVNVSNRPFPYGAIRGQLHR